MICEECKSCPIETLCDEADLIIDENLSLDGEHNILMTIYEKGKTDAIDECIKAIEDSKSLFDNTTKWTMAEKDKLQNRLRQLKEKKE